MHQYSRSEFLRLSAFGTLAFLGARALALPPGYVGIPAGIRPYLHAMRPDSIWVSWITSDQISGTIEWGSSASNLNNTMAATTDTTLGDGYRYHCGRITGLTPNTRYYYRVSNSASHSEVFHFRTPMADGTKTGRLRVLVAGDNQTYTPERRHEKLIACAKYKIEQMYGTPIEDAIDFVITTGDQVDRGIMLHYRDLHFRFNGLISPYLPIMTTVGNHELFSDPGLINYRKLFRYADINYAGITSPEPQLYFSYKVGSICFIHTSSEPEHVSTAQTTWLRQLVDALKNDTTTDLCVSLVHRPYKAAQAIGDTSSWFASQIMPMLAETEKHILTISGHHHYYNRGQTRDWPIYHMISGGTASAQDWSPFKFNHETPYDEVQKTHFNWAWQVIEFDLATRTMEVQSFSEAQGRFPENSRWTSQAYNHRLIDSFHRRLGVAAPEKPSLANNVTSPANDPTVLVSSPFATATTEKLNSSWFQVATNTSFSNLKLNRIRDVEKIYGDTGLPFLEPVDLHNRLDILICQVPTSLPVGTYHARVRHRDTNAMWSAWSDVKTFQITGVAAIVPIVSMPKSIYSPNEDWVVNFENSTGDPGIWIGIYKKGEAPGTATAAAIQAVTGTQGSLTFTDNLPAGEWFATMVASGGLTELAARVHFYVGNTVTLSTKKNNFVEGEIVRVDFANAPGGSNDWIGIYRVGQNPGGNACQDWQYAAAISGNRDFPFIPKGYYQALFMVNDGYQEISARMRFSVGHLIAQIGMTATKVSEHDSFTIIFASGPGLPMDWIGLYRDGDVPGLHPKVHHLYLDGNTSGQVNFDPPDLPAGRYWVAIFTNDSYTEVSSRMYFDVVPLVFEEIQLEDGQMRLRWKTVPGKAYIIQKNTNLEEGNWINVRTLTATGDTLEVTIPTDASSLRCFFRIKRN